MPFNSCLIRKRWKFLLYKSLPFGLWFDNFWCAQICIHFLSLLSIETQDFVSRFCYFRLFSFFHYDFCVFDFALWVSPRRRTITWGESWCALLIVNRGKVLRSFFRLSTLFSVSLNILIRLIYKTEDFGLQNLGFRMV